MIAVLRARRNSVSSCSSHHAVDFVPETRAASIYINEWIDQQGDLAPGTEAVRAVGLCPFELRGVTVNALAQPFRFYLLKRVQDDFESLGQQDQKDVAPISP